MLLTPLLCGLLAVLPADLQKIADNLGSSEYKIRKEALHEAKKLENDKKRILIKELSKSSDPELTETAKELKSLLPEALNQDEVLIHVLKGDLDKIEKALQYNPKAFNKTYENDMNIVDIAATVGNSDMVELLEKSGLKATGNKLKTMDVLVVESDSWESLANDFNTRADLIRLLNKDKGLKPGTVIKVPRGN